MEWWKANRDRYTAWEEVKDTIRQYYGDHYQPERAFNDISYLKQTGMVRKYINNINRLTAYAKMTDHHLINIILNGITPCLCQAVAQNEDLRSNQSKLKKKLIHLDFITTEF